MALDFKELMGKKPVAPMPINTSKDIVETITHNRGIHEIEQMLNDKTIPLSERIRLRRELKEKTARTEISEHVEHAVKNPEIVITDSSKPKEQFALSIILNKKQQLGVEFARAGKSFVYTGKAGTGKTTGTREIARVLLETGLLGEHLFGHYNKPMGVMAPSIAFVAYTNRATDNMRRSIHKDPILAERLQYNVLTIHKLLEYTMEWITNADGKTIPHFYPKRCATNPLDITHLIVEESSMVDIPLWRDQLFAALRPGCVVIFVGDINQLPPVFGPSVLNYALTKLPVVELDEVYRQALDSPILKNALGVLDGKFPVPDGKAFKLFQTKPGGQRPSEQTMASACINTIKQWIEKGEYDVNTDIILSPFNKEHFPCGTKSLNYFLATYLGDKRGAKVHEILAGRNTWYLSAGDRVMVEKQDGVIKSININASYMGKTSKSILYDINRFGKPVGSNNGEHIDSEEFNLEGYKDLNVDDIADEEKKIASSHIVTVEMDDGSVTSLDSAGDFSDAKFCLGYCLSVHKAQGSEWRKVVLVLHKNFKILLFRELIYTAMTRAKDELVIVDLSNSLQGAIEAQRIKGNSVKEKIEWFNSKLALTEDVQVVK